MDKVPHVGKLQLTVLTLVVVLALLEPYVRDIPNSTAAVQLQQCVQRHQRSSAPSFVTL